MPRVVAAMSTAPGTTRLAPGVTGGWPALVPTKASVTLAMVAVAVAPVPPMMPAPSAVTPAVARSFAVAWMSNDPARTVARGPT